MNPKDKAKELVAKMPKQYALICIDEMINITPMYIGNLNPK